MIQKVLTVPDKKLRQISREVVSFDKSLETIIDNLTDTLEAQKNPPGLGLSASQIGVFKRIFVARVKKRIKPYINPQILKFSQKEVTYIEGCLSVPDLYGHVVRPAEIYLDYQDQSGKHAKEHYKGLVARIIQHEVDHLNGTLFIDHVHDQNGKLFRLEKDKGGKDQLIEVAYA